MQPLIPFYEVPVVQLGPLPVHGFGILVALGFVLGGNAAMKRAERTGLDPEAINRLITWLVVGTFVGGHVGYGLMYKPEEYLANPIEFLKVWQGLSSFGGFLVCVPLSFWFFRRHRLPVWPYMDSLAIGLALGWFLGRMGCTVAHDHPGTPSNFFLAKYCRPVEGHTLALPDVLVDHSAPHDIRWGPCRDANGNGTPDGPAVTRVDATVELDGFGVDPSVYPDVVAGRDQAAAEVLAQTPDAAISALHKAQDLALPDGFLEGAQGFVAAHDMGFYEALWSLSVFVLFLALDRWRPWKPGFFVCLLGVLYGPARWGMDLLRPPSTDGRWFEGTALAMTPGQFWSIAFFAVALWGLAVRLRSADRPIGPSAPLREDEGGGRRFAGG